MKQAHFDVSILKENDGKIIGISLGHGMCAEHEWGIEKFKGMFGIGEAPLSSEAHKALKSAGMRSLSSRIKEYLGSKEAPAVGIESRMVTRVKDGTVDLIDYPKETKTLPRELRLICNKRLSLHPDMKKRNCQNPSYRKPDAVENGKEMTVAWNDGSFVIRAFSEEARAAVEMIHQAMTENDLAFGLAQRDIFGRGGLALTVASRMSEEMKALILKDDIDYLKAQEDKKVA